MIDKCASDITNRARGVKRCLAAVAATLAIIGSIAAYLAISYQVSGVASYRDTISKSSARVTVARASSPSEFREVVRQMWWKSAICFVLSAVTFVGYRKLDDFF